MRAETNQSPDPDNRELILELMRLEGALYTPTTKARPPIRPVVYYIRWGERIKIGTSKRLHERLRTLYHDEVLAAEPGSVKLERQRHQRFAEYRLPGQREWFTPAPALMFHINTVRDRFGTNGVPLV